MADKDRGIHRRYKPPPKARKGERQPIAINVEIGGLKGGVIGRAMDLTVDGIKIRSPHNYGVGDRLALTLHIPGFATQFNFPAEVKWIDLAEPTNEYFLGCNFIHTPATHKLLQNLLWELSIGNIPEIVRTSDHQTTRRKLKR
jgi:hypothetical protein